MFSKQWFFSLEKQLRDCGHDSDNQSFDEILENLQNKKIYSPDDFASHCAYVILAGGFSQKTAKRIHETIIHLLKSHGANFDILIKNFNNKNKISAICKIWDNREKLCNDYYQITDLENKINYLQKLPHIGKITANHLARNLGEDVVKYDIWIQRLGCVFAQRPELSSQINNANLNCDIKTACDNMFAHLTQETNLPRGYIDVVLWKAAQLRLISI
jgi:endonuclease III